MASQRLARNIVLSGVAFVVLFSVPFYPFVITVVAYDLISFRSHPAGTVVRLTNVGAALVMAIAAWRRSDVKLAVIFLTMLAGAVAFVVMSNWRWH
jgi:fucose permease